MELRQALTFLAPVPDHRSQTQADTLSSYKLTEPLHSSHFSLCRDVVLPSSGINQNTTRTLSQRTILKRVPFHLIIRFQIGEQLRTVATMPR